MGGFAKSKAGKPVKQLQKLREKTIEALHSISPSGMGDRQIQKLFRKKTCQVSQRQLKEGGKVVPSHQNCGPTKTGNQRGRSSLRQDKCRCLWEICRYNHQTDRQTDKTTCSWELERTTLSLKSITFH